MLVVDFVRLCNDHSMFVHENDMIVVIYVDDLLVCDLKEKDILYFKEKFVERFRVKDLSLNFYYLNVKIMRDRKNRVMHLNQTTYIKQLIEECDLNDCMSGAMQ